MELVELMSLAGGHAEARAIQVALKLKLFEALGERARDQSGLADMIGSDGRATGLLANALAAMGLLRKTGQDYELTPPTRRFLLESSDEYLGGLILFDEALFGLWERLEDAIRSGKPVRAPDMFQQDPAETERFIRAMDSLVRARGDARYVAAKLDFSGVRVLADVGGGPGTYVTEVLRRWPKLRAVIYDLPATLEVTQKILHERASELSDRIELRQFDYKRDEIAERADAVLMSNVIHSEEPETNRRLMRMAFAGLNTRGTLIVKDHIMSGNLTEPRAGAVFSLYLLLATYGRVYSFEEIREWLSYAGFDTIELEPLPSPPFSSSLVVAKRA